MGGLPHAAGGHRKGGCLIVLEALKPQPEDQILMLMDQFRADTRADKIDLGVGVYRNSQGVTPVMGAVKSAERQLWESQTTKGYTSLIGDPAFVDAMRDLVIGDAVDPARLAGAASVGGTGAIRLGLDLARLAAPQATVHIPDPSWPNHRAIVAAIGMPMKTFRYFDADENALDMPGMIADLGAVAAGDVVILHGCCHNPTGSDPTPAQWADIVAALSGTGAVVLVDLAYLGLGDGIEADAAATRMLLAGLPEVIVAVSCSKNFGLYRDRAGVVLVSGQSAAQAALVRANLATLNRLSYSFPADHGARLVEMILADAALHAEWTEELSEMRNRINALRRDLAEALRDATGSDRFAHFGSQRGMFSRLGATPDEVRRLREDHAIYMVGDGRMNIAGLAKEDIPRLARAIAEVCGQAQSAG